ncbi:MAG: NADH:flavin oxidoreductase/NADH oxidase [Micrococcales bacterium]
MSKLFEPIHLRQVEVRNRVWLPPMCQYSCENLDGVVSDWHFVHYAERAKGGFGMIIVEASAVSPEGRITPWDAGIWNQDQADAWSRITAEIHHYGAKAAIQLAHAGRKASIYREWSGSGSMTIEDGGWETVGPTDVAFDGYKAPRALRTEELPAIVKAFGQAAKRSVEAGFDAVEIHAAHGYLIHEFLSPITNTRTDEYGGSLEKRAKLLLEIVSEIRSQISQQVPLMIRFSATDWREDGWNQEQTVQVAKWAQELGADMFDTSSGGLVMGVQIPFGPNYQVPLAEYIAEHVGEPVSAVGLITEAKQAESILEAGQISVVMIGRAALRDPMWPLRAAHELGVELDYWPPQYKRGKF